MVKNKTNSMATSTQDNSSIWIHGLMTVAWADGKFDESEKRLIAEFFHDESSDVKLETFVPVSLEKLEHHFSGQPDQAENFLKTAVMVALADGLYSSAEDQLLSEFCVALHVDPPILENLRSTLDGREASELDQHPSLKSPLDPVKQWLDSVEIHDPKVARFLCKLIPADCPFERDVVLFGRKIVHIPPMCKINPLYEQLVGLRFRSLSFLADECEEDISPYL